MGSQLCSPCYLWLQPCLDGRVDMGRFGLFGSQEQMGSRLYTPCYLWLQPQLDGRVDRGRCGLLSSREQITSRYALRVTGGCNLALMVGWIWGDSVCLAAKNRWVRGINQRKEGGEPRGEMQEHAGKTTVHWQLDWFEGRALGALS